MSTDYLAGRLLQTLAVLFLVSILSFTFLHLSSVDPVTARMSPEEGATLTQEQIAGLQETLGLNDPAPVQYVRWLGRILVGDWGWSIRTAEPVLTALLNRAPVTLLLSGLAMVLAIVVAIPMGIIAAINRNSWLDRAVTMFSLAGLAMPNIWLGLLVILLFSVQLGILPPSGYVPFTDNPLASLQRMILPALVLGTAEMATLARQTRSSMLETLRQEYVQTARAKGLTEYRVIVKHALRNALLPIATVLGFRLGNILSGSVIIETIFGLPGMGRLAVEGIFIGDYSVTLAFVLIVALMVALANLLTDVAYGLLDPRIQLGKR